MSKSLIKSAILIIFFLCHISGFAKQDQLAFPGAEGYGKTTIGGRGGEVYEVTNLKDDGSPGSLRYAVNQSGPRTVVFRVSGTIILNSDLKINNPYITIAGQTAPGDGICLRRYPLSIGADQVIIRYIRIRFGDESGKDADAVSSRYTKNIILDHVSASWSVDETMSIYHCDSITVQWCMVSESMFHSNHVKDNHGFGGIWGSNYGSYHHNLLAHHSSRNPRMASGCGNTDYRNNVIFNWGYNSCYGAEKEQVGDVNHQFSNINMVANYYKPGPATAPGQVTYRIANPSTRNGAADYGKWYVSGNAMDGNISVTANNWNGGVQPAGGTSYIAGLKLNQAWPSMAIEKQTAKEAYYSVLDNVGATLPKKDIVDIRIVNDTRTGTATFEGPTYKTLKTVPDKSKICGIIDSQNDVGGWPVLKSTTAPTDTDHDGIPDDWEISHGLNAYVKGDSKIVGADGYTYLEKYLNSIEFSNPVGNYNLTKLTETSYKLEWGDNYLAEDGFRVERSDNNYDFQEIAILPKYSNTFTDTNVPSGLIAYRVVAFNNDNETPYGEGISNTTDAIHDLISTSGETKVNCFPNPFTDEINIEVSVSKTKKVCVELFDMNGKKIANIADRTFPAGNNSFVWSISNTADVMPGIYIVSVTTDNSNIKTEVKLIKN